MRIAFISYEFPPDTALGGIGTYVGQAAALLSKRGHFVEVFAASDRRSGHFNEGGVGVNLVRTRTWQEFPSAIQPVFSERNAACQFEVVESPEYLAEGGEVQKAHPDLAHIVKLHTPSELIFAIGVGSPTFSGWLRHNLFQARMIVSAVRRGREVKPYQPFCPHKPAVFGLEPLERESARRADLLVSPSQALRDWVVREWNVDTRKTMVVPNPYVPSRKMLDIPIGGNQKTIGFFGRLEQRKGVEDLVNAIPLILQAEPEARFRFVGTPARHPGTFLPFDKYILKRLRRFRHAIEIIGSRPLVEMPEQYAKTDICVFPSVWENFPNVCMEAMSAGRAVVASSAGGMAEMLEGGKHGLLVPPRSPDKIAEAVVRLLRSEDLRRGFGQSARRRVLEAYSLEVVGPQLERSYETAISLSQKRNATAVAGVGKT